MAPRTPDESDAGTSLSDGGTECPWSSAATPRSEVYCRRAKQGHLLDLATGELLPRRCRGLSCPYCIHVQVRDVARAIALARPNWSLLITQVGDDFVQTRRRMNRLRELVRASGFVFEWAWHVEHNPRASGLHVHAWLRSQPPAPPGTFSARAAQARVGWVDLQPLRTRMGWEAGGLHGVGAAGYGMKEALEGLQEAVLLSEVQQAFLEINGKHLVHASRGFWVDQYGRPSGGLRAAAAMGRRLQARQAKKATQ